MRMTCQLHWPKPVPSATPSWNGKWQTLKPLWNPNGGSVGNITNIKVVALIQLYYFVSTTLSVASTVSATNPSKDQTFQRPLRPLCSFFIQIIQGISSSTTGLHGSDTDNDGQFHPFSKKIQLKVSDFLLRWKNVTTQTQNMSNHVKRIEQQKVLMSPIFTMPFVLHFLILKGFSDKKLDRNGLSLT